jgi:3-methyladenine DNA glycosylase Mpg
MKDAKTYRTYAEDCRRIAGKMNGNDKAALLRMAELWDKQAEDAERQEKNNNGRPTA